MKLLNDLIISYELYTNNYDTLITNATQYSTKLLKKNEQCLSVLQCSHLFFNSNFV